MAPGRWTGPWRDAFGSPAFRNCETMHEEGFTRPAFGIGGAFPPQLLLHLLLLAALAWPPAALASPLWAFTLTAQTEKLQPSVFASNKAALTQKAQLAAAAAGVQFSCLAPATAWL